MATTAEYLNKLVEQKNALADNLVTKGVTATHDETLETLVPKVLEISGDGGGVLSSSELYTGTEYNEVTKSISELKTEIIAYLGFGNDGDFIPCNTDGTLGFEIGVTISQRYGETRTSVGSTALRTEYTTIIKNEDIFAFKHGNVEIHIIAKNQNGEYILLWLYSGQYRITTSSATTGWIHYTAPIITNAQYTITSINGLIDNSTFINLYYILGSKTNEYSNHFVNFNGKIFRLFGQGGQQFAVKMN